jgi:hypothetical protein
MKIKTLYLPGFSHYLCGRRAKSTAESLTSAAIELGGLATLGGKFLPSSLFTKNHGQRDRLFTSGVTFWAFLAQVLSRRSSCREAVRRVQAWCVTGRHPLPDEGTSAYCQARKRLPLPLVQRAFAAVERWLEVRLSAAQQWCGRSVKVLDGSGISMPDTAANRQLWPYAVGQSPGCGFPTAQIVGLFCLGTGRLIRFALGTWKAHEIPLARQLLAWVRPGEVVLADRGFCGWGFIAALQRQGVDVVVRVNQARRIKHGLMAWRRPKYRPSSTWEMPLWRALPDELQMRIVRFRIEAPGFRTTEVVLATTLLDPKAYPDEALTELYRRRWEIELCFRDIKSILGLDVLRCQTPALIEKEIWMQAIAYNLVRALMLEAAMTHQVPLDRLSFKGTVDTIRNWAPLFQTPPSNRSHRAELLLRLACDQVPLRPNRNEPRARKRRPKRYQFLTKPRREMRVYVRHRGTPSPELN